jgi:nucleoside-diphosphate-sugar epimerase
MALASRGQSVRRLIFVSSTSVYGQSKGEWVDENSPTKPGQFSGKRLLEGERLVLGSSIGGLVVRFGGIYGRGANRLLQQVLKGSPCQESPPLYTNRIHRDDCVEVLRHLLTLSEPEQIYLGVDSEPAAQCAVMDWLAQQLDVPVPSRSAAKASRGERLRTSKRCRNARLLSTGYRFRYPSFRDGYQAILAKERSSG